LSFGEILFKHRGYTPIPFFFATIILAQPQKDLAIFGVLLIIFGELIRIWGISFAGKATRTKEVIPQKLITNGPYAHVRNPLYLGNIFMYIGAVITANAWLPYLLWITIFYFVIQYLIIISFEEENLQEIFGEEYDLYKQSVPKLLPRLSPYPERTKIKLNLKNALNSELRTLQTIFVFFICLLIRWYF
jgi:protein-S-isoprenylcysteine O-methyltransferase Ste14